MAKTAAERMKEFRERKKAESGLKYTEVYIREELLNEAKSKALMRGDTLREFLREKMEAALMNQVGNPDVNWIATAFIEALPGDVYNAVDDELAISGVGDLVSNLVALIQDGIKYRQTSRSTQSEPVKRGRKPKAKAESNEG